MVYKVLVEIYILFGLKGNAGTEWSRLHVRTMIEKDRHLAILGWVRLYKQGLIMVIQNADASS